MLTHEQNEYLCSVAPGTPGGDLMRRYWHPLYPAAELTKNPVAKVRLLCEDLVLFRDRSGKLGLVDEKCPHRRASLVIGIPEDEGIRCAYHGWQFSADGRCLDQPLEPHGSRYKDRIRIKSYPVEEMGGLIWAYLGPQPVPLLPRWDLFVRERGFRQIVGHQLPCNWLQCMENRADMGHAVYLHGRLFQYALERQGRLTDDAKARYNATMNSHDEMRAAGIGVRYRPIFNEFGFTKGSIKTGQPEDTRSWTIGANPILFPYILAFGPEEGDQRIRRSYQIGVPIDDTHTWHLNYFCYCPPEGVEVPEQDQVAYKEVPLRDENGEYIMDYVLAQDMVAWVEQGPMADRSQENLAGSDVLVSEYRRLLKSQIDRVAAGKEPMNVFRDPALVNSPELRVPGNDGSAPVRDTMFHAAVSYRENYHQRSAAGTLYIDDDADRYCPDRAIVLELFRQSEQIRLTQQAAKQD